MRTGGFFVGSLAARLAASVAAELGQRVADRSLLPSMRLPAHGNGHGTVAVAVLVPLGALNLRKIPRFPPRVAPWVCSGPWAGATSSREGPWPGMNVPFGAGGLEQCDPARGRLLLTQTALDFAFPTTNYIPL